MACRLKQRYTDPSGERNRKSEFYAELRNRFQRNCMRTIGLSALTMRAFIASSVLIQLLSCTVVENKQDISNYGKDIALILDAINSNKADTILNITSKECISSFYAELTTLVNDKNEDYDFYFFIDQDQKENFDKLSPDEIYRKYLERTNTGESRSEYVLVSFYKSENFIYLLCRDEKSSAKYEPNDYAKFVVHIENGHALLYDDSALGLITSFNNVNKDDV